jgi:hypothetical protein
MNVRQIKPRHRSEGGHGSSRRTTVRQDFLKNSWRNLSCIRTSSGRDDSIVRTDTPPLQVISITGFARPDQKGWASGQLNFNTQFPYLMCMRPNHEGQTSGRLKLNRQLPYTMHQRPDHSCQMSGRSIWTAILALWRLASGRDTTSSGRLIDLPFLGIWKESVNRSRTDRPPDVLLKRPDGTSWNRNFSIQYRVRTEGARRPDGMTHHLDGWNSGHVGVRTRLLDRPDGWQGTWNSSDLQAESIDITLKVESLFPHLYT